MNTQKLKLYFGAIALLFLLPSASQAYFTTAQSATQITDDTILYTVTYKFGFAERELYMPIMAQRGIGVEDESVNAGYSILSEDDSVIEVGEANALILTSDTDVEIRDNQYYLPAGESASFTLLALLTIPAGQRLNDTDLSLLVTNLPFTMVADSAVIPNRLNPSELQYYRTPSINLGN